MRQIKLRAWDESQKYMAYQGDVDLETLESFILHFGKKPLMQYTGVEDSYGKDVFEGDILKTFHFSNGKKNNYLYHTVIWSEKFTGWQCVAIGQTGEEHNGNPQLFVYAKQGQFQVIGNIHNKTKRIDSIIKSRIKLKELWKTK